MNRLSPSSIHTLPGADDITRVELPNGITVLARPNFNSPSVVLGGYLRVGSLQDPADKLGLSQFTSLALMRGTQQRSFQQIYDSLESIGASLGFGSGVHTTSFNGRALVEDLPVLLDLLREALQQPAFPADQVERLRAQLLTGLAIRAQDTADMASLTFDELVYAGHPYARPEDGYIETVQAITRDDLVDFHRRGYGPRGMVVVVIGALSPEAAVEQVQQVLGDWDNPLQAEPPELPPANPLSATVTKEVIILGKSQSDIVMGSLGPSRLSPDYMAASLGNNILGQFGMMGRIGEVVREQSGLAYYAYTSLNAGVGPGSWQVTAGVNPVNVQKTIDLVRQEIQRFIGSPVTAEELSDSQENYIGRLPLSLESNQGMAGALLNLERYHLSLDYYRRYPDLVRAVTVETILEVSRRYLDADRLAIAWAGPQNQAEG
ncbi:MAG TPA: pitrilysin family protein [Anaerolineaceae bacterium]|nr:pitrilysin family protein [Anaerolineaceae bacterium]